MLSDERVIFFEREVSRVEQMNLDVLEVGPVGLGALDVATLMDEAMSRMHAAAQTRRSQSRRDRVGRPDEQNDTHGERHEVMCAHVLP